MNRAHATVIAVVLALAALAGVFAAVKTTQLGAAAQTRVSAAQAAKRNRRLDAIEKALLARAARPTKAGAPQSAPVVYVRPKSIVHVVHRRGGEHESEQEGRGGSDD